MQENVLNPQRPLVDIPGSAVSCSYIDDWDGKYAVGCDGSIWSFYNPGCRKWIGPWKKLKLQPLKSGHLHLILRDGDKREFKYVHHAVLLAFVGPRPDGQECRHLDGKPPNNWWWNLKWGTRQENVDDKENHGTVLTCETHPRTILTRAEVVAARTLYSSGETMRRISEIIGRDRATLHSAIIGKSWFNVTDPPPCRTGTALREERYARIREMKLAGRRVFDIATEVGMAVVSVYQAIKRMGL